MTIQRIVPHVSTSSLDAQDAFYLGVLGLERLYVDPGRLHGYGIPGSGQHAVTVLTRDIVDPAVSYTHLDVYKRQAMPSAHPCC